MQKGGKTTLTILKNCKNKSPPEILSVCVINTQTHEIAQISFIQSPHNPFQKDHYATWLSS